ncbi:MAG: iron-sulfur cluster assembly scaffold protein [Armatimonadetes bacterium]|nr:iron-sulfur cluster assembly scaffold protein [Armatimonadota bacterium]
MDTEKEVVKKYILDMWGNYSETVLDHALNPRNVGSISEADGFGEGTGECEDTMVIWLRVVNDRITEATFWTDGCGTTIACGSMVTELAKGKTVKEAFLISREEILQALGGLPEESVHCAALAAGTLKNALQDYLEMKRFPWKKAYRQE